MANRIAEYFRNRKSGGSTPTERVMNTIKSAARWMKSDPAWMVKVLQDQRKELMRIRRDHAEVADMARSQAWQEIEGRLIEMIRAHHSVYVQYGGANKELALINWILARSYANLIAMVAGPEREHDVASQLLQENTVQMLKTVLGKTAPENPNAPSEN